MLPQLIVRWDPRERPLTVRTLTTMPGQPLLAAPPWLQTGPVERPFDFAGHVRRLLEDIVNRCDDLAHIDVSRILLAATIARNNRRHGLQARVTPLRFRNGQLTRQRRGVLFQVQRLFLDDHEFLYVMTFCLPRFLNQDFDDKFVTLFHELFHIGTRFDGDLRRHDGRYELHSHNHKEYDRHMAHLARVYLAGKPDPALHAFLRLDFNQLCRRHNGVDCILIPRPKVFPILKVTASAAQSS
jgi:hypothetical protein